MFLRRLAAFFTDRRGNVGIIFGLTAVPAIGVVGAGIDFARANHERAALQSMLDSAVLAGVAAAGKEATTAKAFFDAQAASLALTDANASFAMGADSTLTGTATGTMETTLLGVMHITTIALGANAAARVFEARPRKTLGAGGEVCILLVDPNASQSLLVNGGAEITAPDCEIHVRSTGSPAVTINGSAELNVQKICVKGSKATVNGSVKAPVETDCAALDDPYAGKLPTVAVPGNCTVSNANYNANGADVDLPSGNYCTVNINGASNVTMQPGLFQNVTFNGSTRISDGSRPLHLQEQQHRQFRLGDEGRGGDDLFPRRQFQDPVQWRRHLEPLGARQRRLCRPRCSSSRRTCRNRRSSSTAPTIR